jgi:uncharacterized protein (TIGR03437 family)
MRFELLTLAASLSLAASPAITKVTNNYSYIPSGFSNSGIAPSSIFTIFGAGMANPGSAAVLQDSSKGLPTTLNGASLSITVAGKTMFPAMYYALPTQIAAVMPALTPTGTGTLTVTFNGVASSPFPIQIVAAAPGLDTYYGTGSGLVTATNAITGALYNYANSAKAGDIIVLWGAGLGADTADSDTTFASPPKGPDLSGVTKIYFGAAAGVVGYAGPSGYPGLQQINVTVPAGVTGCGVSVVAVVNGVTSNFGSLPVMPNGGSCSDPNTSLSGSQVSGYSTQNIVRSGFLEVGQSVIPGQTSTFAVAVFNGVTGNAFAISSGALSMGSCTITQSLASDTSATAPATPLDFGSLNLQGPLGSYQLFTSTGIASGPLPASAIPSSGGTFTFSWTGGADIGKGSGVVNLPSPLLSWTNPSAGAAVVRAQGLHVTWTGGTPGSYVVISGASSGSDGTKGNFACYAPQSALQFDVPSYVLNPMPAGSGNVNVQSYSSPTQFSVSGIDYGFGLGFNTVTMNGTYQ